MTADQIAACAHIPDVIAAQIFIPGYDKDDVRQEAWLGVLEAVTCYDGSSPFGAFAFLVAKRKVLSVLTSQQYEKRRVLNEAARNMTDIDGTDVPIVDTLADVRADVPAVVEQRADIQKIIRAARRFSVLEREAFTRQLNGTPYMVDGAKDKRIDNALIRVRAKLAAA